MKILTILGKIIDKPFRPIRENAPFFVFMYGLGVLCAWLTQPDGKPLYEHLYSELFVDVYLLCLVLALIPRKARRWVKAVLYVALYGVAIVDVYCWVKFESTLTPTMLLLVGETDTREAGEFLRTYLSPDVIFSSVGWVVLLLLVHVFWTLRPQIEEHLTYRQRVFLGYRRRKGREWLRRAEPFLGAVVLVVFCISWSASYANKKAFWRIMHQQTVGGVEHALTQRGHANFYTPVNRLLFSLRANSLASEQIDKLISAADKVQVDSCSFRSPNIVLIIGESYGKQHSAQYGYFMPTTPRQSRRERSGLLVKFTDVVSPWNLTSYVFKNVFSMHVVGQQGEWSDYPLFPEVFRKAGYHVTFLTNQFLPKAKEEVYDFSGGFFLNNPTLSKAQFDTRNSQVFRYDAGLLSEYRRLQKEDKEHQLTIFHLIGQHVSYRQRSPRDRWKFKGSDYADHRPELNDKQRQTVADYDNAVLYNDSIVDRICKLYEHTNTVVIYMPDHGEECYEGTRGITCRLHSARVDYDLARYEFEVPFWIWCSHEYVVRHPEIYREIIQARHRRFMTDALPHLLLYLAGISAPSYHAEYNVLSPDYNELRPRLLKKSVDYDKLREAHEAKQKTMQHE